MYLNCFAQVFPSRYSLYIYIFWTQYSILLRNFQKRQLIRGEPEEENRELSKFHLRSREGNQCWDSLIWVSHSTPVESMDTILIMGSCVPLERLLLKTKTKNKTKQKKNEKENEKWEEEWTQTERRLDQTWLILRTWSVGFPLKSVTASKK